MSEAFIYDALRTPRGRASKEGALYEVKPIHLLSSLLSSLKSRHDFSADTVDDLIVGCATPTADQGFNIARTALLHLGWEEGAGGMQISRYCTSGLEAINLAAAKIGAGWEDLIIAGGVESMSRVPLGSDMGPLMYDPAVLIRSHYLPPGVAADLVATLEGYSREELDEYALLSYQRSQARSSSSPSVVPILDQSGLMILAEDELGQEETSAASLADLAPAFQAIGAAGFDAMAIHRYPSLERIHHLHTAGNSCSNADGAALVLLANKKKGNKLGLKARARIRMVASATVDPTIMFTAAVPAARRALQAAKMEVEDIDLWECNEAFAAVVLKFQRDLHIPIEKLNVRGGAIALGHPVGATGAILLNTVLDELEERDLNTGMITLCAGAGLAVATIIERV